MNEAHGNSDKWRILALLWVAFFLQQGTRQLFGPSVSAIGPSLGADNVSVGFVGTVFALMYGLCVPFAGLAADLFNRKWMVAAGVLIFCCGIFCSGFVASTGLLILTYGILNGFGQTFFYPSATSLIAQVHAESRATAMSILQLALYIGLVGCGSLAGFLSGRGGESWRLPFWILGGLGLIWTVVLARFLPNTKPVASPLVKPSLREAALAVFAKPTAICVIVGVAMVIYVDIGFKNWMPSHLQETFGAVYPSLRRLAGLHAVLWYCLGAGVGILSGSRFGDRWVKRYAGIRLELGVVGLGLAIPFIVWMSFTRSFVLCCVAMFGFGLFRGVYDSNCMASFFDAVNPRYHAFGVGIMMCVAFLFGSFSSTVLPWLQNSLGPSTGIASLAVFYLIGALILLLARIRFWVRDGNTH